MIEILDVFLCIVCF